MDNINLIINNDKNNEKLNKPEDIADNMKDYAQYQIMKSIITRNLLNDMYFNKKSSNYIKNNNNQRIFFFILRQINYLNIPKKQIKNFTDYIEQK